MMEMTVFRASCSSRYCWQTMYLSKITAAILDDLNYIVDPSEVILEALLAVES